MYYRKTIALLLGLSLSVGLLSGCAKREKADPALGLGLLNQVAIKEKEPTDVEEQPASSTKTAFPVLSDYTQYAVLEESAEGQADSTAPTVPGTSAPIGDLGKQGQTEPAKGTSWTVYRGVVQNEAAASDPGASQYLYLYRLEAEGSVIAYATDTAGNRVGQVESNLNDETRQASLLEGVQEIQSWAPCEGTHYARNMEMLYGAKLDDQTVLYVGQDQKSGQLQFYDEAGNLTALWKTEYKFGAGLDFSTQTDIPLGEEAPAPVHAETEPEKPTEVPAESDGETGPEKPTEETTEPPEEPGPQEQKKGLPVWALILAALGGLALGGLTAVLLRPKKENAKMPKENAKSESAGIKVGALHNIGRRSGQQDSYDVVKCGNGLLAVVADGMGGLSDGDKVSQKIVATFHEDAARVRPGHSFDALYQMVGHANREVNRMLGSSLQGKCGSTLLAVLLENDQMQWTAVGDSRIYLYRGGSLLQVNREHTYKIELLERAVNGEMSFADMRSDSQLGRVCSYLGMGRLKHVDGSLNMVKLLPGDRVLLMSDGVFNTLSEEEIAAVLRRHEDVDQAAQILEKQVLGKQSPTQDNFTCVILKV